MAVSSITSGLITTAPGGGASVPSGPSPGTGSPASTSVAGAAPVPTAEQVSKAASQVNDAFLQKGQSIYASIEIDRATGMSVVKFVDTSTKQEIGQYPSKAIVAMADSLARQQDAKGQLLHVSA
jgi:uncharacterized FlaG/YvyC family protein